MRVLLLRSVREIFFDSYQDWSVHGGLPDRNPENYKLPYQSVIFDSKGRKQAVIPKCNLLDVAFSPDYVAICTGDIHFISRLDSDKRILYRAQDDSHTISIAYSPKVDAFFGIQYNTRKRVSSLLLKFDVSLDEPVVITKTFSGTGTYQIKAKAKDIFDDESSWGMLEISMPLTYSNNYPIWQWLQTHFPILSRLLNLLVGFV